MTITERTVETIRARWQYRLVEPDASDVHWLLARLEAAEAQNLALIERMESLQFENLKLRERAEKAERALSEIRDIPFASGAVGLIASGEAVRRMLLTASRALGSADPDSGYPEPGCDCGSLNDVGGKGGRGTHKNSCSYVRWCDAHGLTRPDTFADRTSVVVHPSQMSAEALDAGAREEEK